MGHAGFRSCVFGRSSARGGGTIFEETKRLFSHRAQRSRFGVRQPIAFPDDLQQQWRRFGDAHSSEGFGRLDAEINVAQRQMFSCRNLQQKRNGRRLMRKARDDRSCREQPLHALPKSWPETPARKPRPPVGLVHFISSVTARSCKFHSQLASARGSAPARRLGSADRQKMNCSRDALAARFIQPRLQRAEHRLTCSVNEPHHRRKRIHSAGRSEQQAQPVDQPVRASPKQARDHGAERPVRKGFVHQIKPLIVVQDASHQGRDMCMLVIPRRRLERLEDSFEFGVVMLYQRNASQIFDDRGQQTGNPRRTFQQQRLHNAGAQTR